MAKKGIEAQFHWIFILIAGALILAFFFSVAMKQRALSQEKLQLTLATDVENIFTAAIVSKGTAQKVPVPPQGIAFECTQGCACEFRIARAPRQFGDKTIFAPELLAEQDLTVWSLPFGLPYRATNFLYLTNPDIKYYFVHDGEQASKNLFQQITKNIPPLIDYEIIKSSDMGSIREDGYQHTKFVFVTFEPNYRPSMLHTSFRRAEASAVKLDQRSVVFYEKEGTTLVSKQVLSYAGMPSVYAAIFAHDHTMYRCGLQTAFRKLSYLSQLYIKRAQELKTRALESQKEWCAYDDIISLLQEQQEAANALSQEIDESRIIQLNSLKDQLERTNRNYVQQSCPELF